MTVAELRILLNMFPDDDEVPFEAVRDALVGLVNHRGDLHPINYQRAQLAIDKSREFAIALQIARWKQEKLANHPPPPPLCAGG